MTMKLSLLLILCCVGNLLRAPLQAQERISAPGFDPSPLKIERVVKGTRHPISTMDLLTLRDLRGMQISPDGKSLVYAVAQAVYETNAYRTALFVVGTHQDRPPIKLGSPGPPRWDDIGVFRPYVLGWSPDSRDITCLMNHNGSWQVWRWKREGGEPEQLTHNSQDVQDYEWSFDGSKIIFTTTEPIDEGVAKDVLERGIVYDSSIRPWGRDTFPRLVIQAKPKKTHTWVYEVGNSQERKATADEETRYKETHSPPNIGPGKFARAPKLSPDGTMRAFAVIDSESNNSIFIERKSGEPLQILPPSVSYIANLWWSKNSSEIYFNQLVDDQSILRAVAIKDGRLRDVSTSADYLYSFSFDSDQSIAACVRYNTTVPPQVAILDMKTGVPWTLVDVNPEFQNIALSPASKLEWTNKYGDKTYGYLINPLNYVAGKRYPLIVTTYAAGGFLRGAAGDEYPIQVFAANGFAVLDFAAPRRSAVKDGNFTKKLLTWYSPMESLATAMKILEDQGIIDPNRMGLSGLSYGAEITEFTISHSDLFQAAVTSGPSGRDPFVYYLVEKGYQKYFAEWGLEGLPEGKAAARWQELSPALNASRIKAPLLIQTADSELLGTLMLYNSLKQFNKPAEMIVYADEGHIKNQPKHRYEIYERNLDWFRFWLQGEKDISPAKQGQYERWTTMKQMMEKSKLSSR